MTINTPVIYATQEEVDAGLVKWQKLLRLQDWAIEAEVARGFVIPEKAGECEILYKLKEARIRLLDPVDFEPTWFGPAIDHEQVLVHELIHLHSHAFEPEKETLQHDLWEQAVEQLAKAFISVDRA